MKIYVAGAWSDRANVSMVAEEIAAEAGCVITFRWWEKGPSESTPERHRRSYLRECGVLDLNGVADADAVVFVYHDDTRGAWLEMGYAIALLKPIFVLGEASRVDGSPFMHLQGVNLHRTQHGLTAELAWLATRMAAVRSA